MMVARLASHAVLLNSTDDTILDGGQKPFLIKRQDSLEDFSRLSIFPANWDCNREKSHFFAKDSNWSNDDVSATSDGQAETNQIAEKTWQAATFWRRSHQIFRRIGHPPSVDVVETSWWIVDLWTTAPFYIPKGVTSWSHFIYLGIVVL